VKAPPAAVGVGLLLTLVTIELLAGYWIGTIPRAGNTATQYWHIVLP